MKTLRVLFAGSLVANAMLAVFLFQDGSNRPPANRIGPSGAKPEETANAPKPTPAITASTHVQASAPRDVAGFRTLADQLRASGLSEEVVRNVVEDVIGHHYKARRRELGLDLAPDPAEFWRSPVIPAGADTPERIAGRRALEREARETLRAVFGPDYDVSDEDRRRRAHGLPGATAEKLHKIFSDYRDMEQQARDDATSTGDIRGKLELLAKEKRADIERLLTPEQLLEFDLRMGAGSGLHNRLGAFRATEAEFRALYVAQKAFLDANPGLRMPERNERFEPELGRILGEARYAELLAANERSQRGTRDWIEMRQFAVDGHNLSPSVASEVLALQAQYQPQLAVVNESSSLTAGQKAVQRAALGAAARKELLRVLGPTAFESYEKAKGGWLPPVSKGPAAPAP